MRNSPSIPATRHTLILLAVAGSILLGCAYRERHSLAVVRAAQVSTREIVLPFDYRDWRLISVAHEEGNLNDLRAVLGNDVAVRTYRSGSHAFPDGAAIVRLAWTYAPSKENNRAFGREQSFVAGLPTNIQLMVKDSLRFAATDGWGFAQFANPQARDEAKPSECSGCHKAAKEHDEVFTRYAR